jgi:sulfur carrier protein ThiS
MARRKKETNEEKVTLVKVSRTGGRVEEYALEGEEPTVGDALQKAGITLTKGDRVRIGGDVVDVDTIVDDGDIITIAGKVSGGNR